MLHYNWLLLTGLLSSSVLATDSEDLVGSLTVEGKEAASATVALETCNPLKAQGCPADKALATSIFSDFKSEDSHYLPYRTPSEILYTDEGLQLTLAKRFDNPSLVSDFYIMFGKVEVWLKSAPGQGVISSFYLQSDDLDEVDMEWFGGDVSQMQSNFFSKGDTTTYDRGQYHDMADPRAEYHNYTLDWNQDALTWYIDGNAVRTLASDTASGYPQSPMRLFFGIWAGGDPTNAEGTIEWAGGLTDYSGAPFSMHMKSLVVSDYSTGSEYSYSDDSGSWESIVAKDGKVNGRRQQADEEFAALVENGNDAVLTQNTKTSSGSVAPSTTSSSSTADTSTSSSSSSTSNTHDSTTSSSSSTSSTEESTTSSSSSASTAEDSTTTTATNNGIPTTLETSSTTKSETTHHSSSKSSSSTFSETPEIVTNDNGAIHKTARFSSIFAIALLFANMI